MRHRVDERPVYVEDVSLYLVVQQDLNPCSQRCVTSPESSRGECELIRERLPKPLSDQSPCVCARCMLYINRSCKKINRSHTHTHRSCSPSSCARCCARASPRIAMVKAENNTLCEHVASNNDDAHPYPSVVLTVVHL